MAHEKETQVSKGPRGSLHGGIPLLPYYEDRQGDLPPPAQSRDAGFTMEVDRVANSVSGMEVDPASSTPVKAQRLVTPETVDTYGIAMSQEDLTRMAALENTLFTNQKLVIVTCTTQKGFEPDLNADESKQVLKNMDAVRAVLGVVAVDGYGLHRFDRLANWSWNALARCVAHQILPASTATAAAFGVWDLPPGAKIFINRSKPFKTHYNYMVGDAQWINRKVRHTLTGENVLDGAAGVVGARLREAYREVDAMATSLRVAYDRVGARLAADAKAHKAGITSLTPEWDGYRRVMSNPNTKWKILNKDSGDAIPVTAEEDEEKEGALVDKPTTLSFLVPEYANPRSQKDRLAQIDQYVKQTRQKVESQLHHLDSI